jgi:hypothetical protein
VRAPTRPKRQPGRGIAWVTLDSRLREDAMLILRRRLERRRLEGASALTDDLTWLCTEIERSYHIGGAITRQWIEERRLILLLDGLDELWGDRRGQCVAWINGYKSGTQCRPRSCAAAHRPWPVVDALKRASAKRIDHAKSRGCCRATYPGTDQQLPGVSAGDRRPAAVAAAHPRYVQHRWAVDGASKPERGHRGVRPRRAARRPVSASQDTARLSRLANPKMRSAAHVYMVQRRLPWVGLPGELAPELRYSYCLGMLPRMLAGFGVVEIVLPLTLRYGLVCGLVAAACALLPAIVLGEKIVKEVPAGPVQPGSGWLACATAGAFAGLVSWGLAEGVRAATGLHWMFPAMVGMGAGAFAFLGFCRGSGWSAQNRQGDGGQRYGACRRILPVPCSWELYWPWRSVRPLPASGPLERPRSRSSAASPEAWRRESSTIGPAVCIGLGAWDPMTQA